MTTLTSLRPGAEPFEPTLRDWRSIARLIDHTLLRPDATPGDAERACAEATFYGLGAVFVQPALLATAVAALRGTAIKPGTPIGFPYGANSTVTKRFEAGEALKVGARELDMVLNIGALKAGARVLVRNDVATLVRAAHDAGATLKVILEAGLLTIEEKILACELCVQAGADFVKTSTGLWGGATVEDVVLLRGVVGQRAGVKASGGIRNAAKLAALLAAGADRIGCSASVHILRELGAPAMP